MAETYDKKRRLILSVTTVFLVVGLAGAGWWWYQSTKRVNTDDARVSGTIVSVSAKIPGQLVAVLIKEGSEVRAGQVVARIDARETKAQKTKAVAALAAAKARYQDAVAGSRPQEIELARNGLDQANASLNDTVQNYARMQKLFADGAISAAQRDTAQTAYLVAKEVSNGAKQKLDLTLAGTRQDLIDAAAADMEQAQAALEVAAITDEYTAIVSPVDGIVALKSANDGEVVAAGQPLFSIVDSNDLWLNARIEETKISKVKIGQKVDYTIDGYPNHTFTGQVYEVGIATNSTFALIPTENASGNFTKVTQRVPIKITLPDKTEGIVFRPGMQAIIDIELR